MRPGLSNAELKLRMARNALSFLIELHEGDRNWAEKDSWVKDALAESAPADDDKEVPQD